MEISKTKGDNTMKPRIAMIDDESDITESYMDLLGDKYDISPFTDPDSFIAQTKKPTNGPYELIVLDYNLGPKSGLDMVVELKKLKVSAPLILMSGYLDKDSTLKAHNLGIAKILEKPVNYQLLDEEISSLLLETQLAMIQKKTRDLAFEVNAVCSTCSIYFNEVAEREQTNQFFDILSRQLSMTNTSFTQHKYFEELQAEIFRHIKTEELLIRQIQRKKMSAD